MLGFVMEEMDFVHDSIKLLGISLKIGTSLALLGFEAVTVGKSDCQVADQKFWSVVLFLTFLAGATMHVSGRMQQINACLNRTLWELSAASTCNLAKLTCAGNKFCDCCN